MATTSPGTRPTGAGEENQLRRAVGLRGLTLISLGSIIGSGWLLGALTASKVAGGASILSWILAGAVLALLALVHAELGSTYPVSGGTARFPYMIFGALGGFTGGWMAWLQAVTIAPIEVEATLGYLNSKFTSLNLINANGTLDGKGILIGAGFMLVFAVINMLGVRWLAETNAIAVYWKILIPTITIIALVFSVFHFSNFTAGGGFAPYGFHGIFAALPLGVVFAIEGFEQAIQVGGEAENPQRNIPRAVILSMIIGTVIYLLLEVAFVGALNPANLVHGWANPISGVKAFGPYATLATTAGLGWLSTLLIIDAVVSPAGTGLVYIGTSSRAVLRPGPQRLLPPGDQPDQQARRPVRVDLHLLRRRHARVPARSRAGRPGRAASPRRPCSCTRWPRCPWPDCGAGPGPATGVPAARRGRALPAVVRLREPDRVLRRLEHDLLAVRVHRGRLHRLRYLPGVDPGGTPDDHRLAGGGVDHPWLVGLIIISWLGRYDGAPPTVFGLTLLSTKHIPNWWDLVVSAAWSLAIYYWAVASTMSHDKVDRGRRRRGARGGPGTRHADRLTPADAEAGRTFKIRPAPGRSAATRRVSPGP